jgi:hypothetical protein
VSAADERGAGPAVSAPDERGIALPLAVLALMIAVQLTLALSAMSAPEVAIASNHLLAVQARAAAESGLDAARVALSNPHILSTSFPAALAAAPLIRIPGTGAGYRIAMAIDPAWTVFEKANQRRVTVAGLAALGHAIDLDATESRAVATLEAILRRDSLPSTLLVPAPALLAGGGLLKTEIDARRDPGQDFEPWCARPGQILTPLGGAAAGGAHVVENAGLVWGPGDAVPNEAGRDLLHGGAAPPDSLFASYAFTPEELAALKALAVSMGTFYQGRPVVFGAHAPLPAAGSLVYVEGDVEVEAYGNDTAWTGWLVAVGPSGPGSGGRIAFRCDPGCSSAWSRLTVNGLLYAEDRLEVATAGANRSLTVNGAVITRNLGGIANRLEPERAADVRIALRCQGDGGARRGVRDAIAGTAETIGVFDREGRAGWFLKPGSYREIAGQP